MSFEIEGTLHRKYPTENKSGSFQAREFVLQISSGQYPEHPKFQLVQDRVSLLDQFEEGDRIKVMFDLRGREWQGKFFTNLNCWRIARADGEESGGSGSGSATVSGAGIKKSAPAAFDSGFPEPTTEPIRHDSSQNDDLPF